MCVMCYVLAKKLVVSGALGFKAPFCKYGESMAVYLAVVVAQLFISNNIAASPSLFQTAVFRPQ